MLASSLIILFTICAAASVWIVASALMMASSRYAGLKADLAGVNEQRKVALTCHELRMDDFAVRPRGRIVSLAPRRVMPAQRAGLREAA